MARDLQLLKRRIGERVRARRQELAVSQEQLAFQADISPTYLSQIEAGKRNPSLETLFRLALGLKLEITDLLKP